ncbi:hypothetical protein AKJ66_00785 [candidate division MSBL1 archaeon SCGC-AAA259E22]|uniref:DUF1893 domain-containing protein n=1 Tax=candidate division MSBL1 archaeon SCGC-AAA259E22 TaxID=1698265 RepID=A0A133UHZ5_9EURY|nr:hypothetical protein AKJ66_00785 [candidate division MSBL1 archaeon SCGC-AAA259E22]
MDLKMDDLKLAENTLKRDNLNLVIAKNGKLAYKTKLSGIKGLLKAIEKLDYKTNEYSAADKIVGRAAALLLIFMNVKKIYAITLSEGGKSVLEKNEIEYKYENIVSEIKNIEGKNMCPFEKLTRDIDNPEKAYLKVKSKVTNLENSSK